jgi:hypothetical protein
MVELASNTAMFRTTVEVDGEDLGVFDTCEGGAVSAEISKRRPGTARSKRATYGGPQDTDDVTIAREWVRSRDYPLQRRLRTKTGWAEVRVTRVPLDPRFNVPSGAEPEILVGGLLQQVQAPDSDSDGNDTAMLSLVVVGGEWR